MKKEIFTWQKISFRDISAKEKNEEKELNAERKKIIDVTKEEMKLTKTEPSKMIKKVRMNEWKKTLFQ